MNPSEYRKRVRAHRHWEQQDRQNRHRIVRLLAALGITIGLLCCLLSAWAFTPSANGSHAALPSTIRLERMPADRTMADPTVPSHALRSGERHDAERGCAATVSWPVADPQVTDGFDQPPRPWLPGHRGVDIRASPGGVLLAPADGVIAFAGQVAGKHVVTVRHGRLTSTFEPARTDSAVGAAVARGRPFATVEGASDHCGRECVHWGVKTGDDEYRNPTELASLRKIVVKPVTES